MNSRPILIALFSSIAFLAVVLTLPGQRQGGVAPSNAEAAPAALGDAAATH